MRYIHFLTYNRIIYLGNFIYCNRNSVKRMLSCYIADSSIRDSDSYLYNLFTVNPTWQKFPPKTAVNIAICRAGKLLYC
jgi:hypothetical protein